MSSDALVEALRAALGDGAVLTADDDLTRYEHGWRYGHGTARCVARPRDTGQVAAVLRLCREHGARVVVQGANTGLVGASTPDQSGGMVVLATERMDHTIDVDVHNRTAVVSAGVRLGQLQERLRGDGLMFPIDLGADPQLGGMIATNTGGTRLLRYGDVRKNVLGLEVVLGDGTVLEDLHGLRKRNTGFDSNQLFIGSSGVFGIVTRAVLQLSPLPAQRAVAMVGCGDGAAVLRLLAQLERGAGELLSAFEVMSRNALAPTFAHHEGLRSPFRGELPRYAVLVELATSLLPVHLLLDDLLVAVLGDVDADVFLGEPDAFWAIRHHISESLRQEGNGLAFDISVPRSQLPAFGAAAAQLVAQQWPFARLCDYGHWGDGGTHLVLVWRDEDAPAAKDALVPAMQRQVYDLAVGQFGGSWSAEHGVGPHNQECFDRYIGAGERRLGRLLKAHCDPTDRLGTVRLW